MCRFPWCVPCLICIFTLAFPSCTSEPVKTSELIRYPADDMKGLIATSGVEVDAKESSDGNGSIRFAAADTTTYRLYETGDLDVENARLIYRAKIRTKDVTGKVYLEMWCRFPDRGKFFSRALDSARSGTNEWASQETLFFLKKGENPDNIRLNLVIEGKGTVWLDDIRLLEAAL